MAGYLHDGVLLYMNQLVDWDSYFRMRKGDDVDVEAERAALVAVLQTTAEVCEEIERESRPAWELAAHLENGEVVLPPHMEAAYQKLRAAGLVALSVDEEYGGFAMPSLLANIALQKIARANAALMTIMGLQAGVAEDIQRYADEELRKTYLPRFASGELQGAMDLTESQAGSDLGGIQTRATEEGDRVFLDGQKIFITNGGAEIHLVLARDDDSYDASKGTTKGLSLFICPRTLPDGSKNGIRVERLEHKLGIHGSPTASVRFDHAEAFRIGTKGEGFKAMLDLMNDARLGVAAQGIGIAEAALDLALEFAKQREQFGKPIAEQPLMKNWLAGLVFDLEGRGARLYRWAVLVDRNRAIEAYLGRETDLSDAERGAYKEEWERNRTRIRLLTPLAKYRATETCDEITRTAIQVHGGLGFMAESAVGKLHLDGIITTIYEGTSEIQVSFALKEIGRGALQTVFEELERELGELGDERLAPFADKVRAGITRINHASAALLQDFNYALLCARHVAEMVIEVIAATELLRQADVSPRRFDLAASYVNRKMLELELHASRVEDGDVGRLERCERILDLME